MTMGFKSLEVTRNDYLAKLVAWKQVNRFERKLPFLEPKSQYSFFVILCTNFFIKKFFLYIFLKFSKTEFYFRIPSTVTV